MKYRVKIDPSFDTEVAALTLLGYAKALAEQAVSINADQPNAELSFCHYELCRHDEGLPCTLVERLEIKGQAGGASR